MGNLITWGGPEYSTTWQSTEVYSSTTETGTYTLLATITPITVTKYFDAVAMTAMWYKIRFVNSTINGPYSDPFFVSVTRATYITPTELRKFMGFEATDFPNDEAINILLEGVYTQIVDDAGGITNPLKLKLLSYLLGSSFVCRNLATRALSKGYVAVSMEGINIQKAHASLLQLADYYFGKYQEQLAKDTVDYAVTSFMDDTIGVDTVQEIKDIMNGVDNALDFQSTFLPSMNKRTGNNN